jgi:hypothetical protein
MSNATETTSKKANKPDLYIFSGEGEARKIVGRVYFHGKGSGMNILVGGQRYSAFPPKAKGEGA